MLYQSIEIAMLALFLVVLADAVRSYRENSKKLLLLVLAFVYVVLFENFNLIIAKGTSVSYFYNPLFAMYIWYAPFAIVLAWTVLIYTTMLNLKTLVRPFADSLLILLLILSISVVAVRQNIWTWVGFQHTQGWLGVPADYLISWMFLVFMFSFLFRYFTRADDDMVNKATRTEYYFLLPAFAYLAMLIVFSLVNIAEDILMLTSQQEVFLLWALVILFAAVIRTPKQAGMRVLSINMYTIFTILLTRLLLFFYITWSVVLMEIYKELPEIIVILVVTITAEIAMQQSAFGHIGKQIELKLKPGQTKMKSY